MNIGDRVKTPFGEYGLIISKAVPPNDWVIENAEDDDVYESYPEASLVLIPRPADVAASDRVARILARRVITWCQRSLNMTGVAFICRCKHNIGLR